MIKTKFTSGPWEIEGYAIEGPAYPGDPKRPTIMGGEDREWCVAIVQTDHEKPYEANAHLIAAAPELYEMLSSIENDNGSIPQGFWNEMQRVLRKARGEE